MPSGVPSASAFQAACSDALVRLMALATATSESVASLGVVVAARVSSLERAQRAKTFIEKTSFQVKK